MHAFGEENEGPYHWGRGGRNLRPVTCIFIYKYIYIYIYIYICFFLFLVLFFVFVIIFMKVFIRVQIGFKEQGADFNLSEGCFYNKYLSWYCFLNEFILNLRIYIYIYIFISNLTKFILNYMISNFGSIYVGYVETFQNIEDFWFLFNFIPVSLTQFEFFVFLLNQKIRALTFSEDLICPIFSPWTAIWDHFVKIWMMSVPKQPSL